MFSFSHFMQNLLGKRNNLDFYIEGSEKNTKEFLKNVEDT